jgi:hypothetical protein
LHRSASSISHGDTTVIPMEKARLKQYCRVPEKPLAIGRGTGDGLA